MNCKSCGSDKLGNVSAEIALHFPGLQGLTKPIVWVFPEVFVCLNCGKAEFAVPETQLSCLADEQPDSQSRSNTVWQDESQPIDRRGKT